MSLPPKWQLRIMKNGRQVDHEIPPSYSMDLVVKLGRPQFDQQTMAYAELIENDVVVDTKQVYP